MQERTETPAERAAVERMSVAGCAAQAGHPIDSAQLHACLGALRGASEVAEPMPLTVRCGLAAGLLEHWTHGWRVELLVAGEGVCRSAFHDAPLAAVEAVERALGVTRA